MKSELEQFLSLPLGRDDEPLNKLELTSVRALISYAAHNQEVNEEVLHEAVINQFGVKDVAELHSQSYDDVIRFLISMQANMLLN